MKKLIMLLCLLAVKAKAAPFLIGYSNANPNDSVMYSSASLSGILYTVNGVQFNDGSVITSARAITPTTINVSSATALSITLTPQTTTFLAALVSPSTGTIAMVQEDNPTTGVPYANSLLNECAVMGNGSWYYISVTTNAPTAVVGATCTK